MTSPTTAWCSSQRSQTASTCSSICGRTTATIRSWLSEITSQGSILLAQRHLVQPEVDPALARHLREGGGEAGGAAVLQRLDEPRLDELDRDLDQLLAEEGIADLDGRPLVGVVLAQLLAREHGGASDPVPSGGRAVEDDEVARAGGAGAGDPVGGEEPDAHRVHEHVVAVGLVEDGLAAHRRHADRVAVRADAGTARSKPGSPGAKRSPSSSAIGLAPMAMTSRRIPPTPVAAPWNGSTAEGWLWLSTLKQTASPSPRSITPAFSPGPAGRVSPRRKAFQGRAECL